MNGYMNVPTTRPIEVQVERTSSRPRFPRFSAMMQAEPPPTGHMLDEKTQAEVQHMSSALADPPVCRSTGARAGTNPWILWLGIGSWTLLCAALLASLLSWHEREVLERDGAISNQVQKPATVSDAVQAADHNQSMPIPQELLPQGGPKKDSEARPHLDTIPAPQGAAKPRLEEADLLANGVDVRVPGGLPLPRFKPPNN
jgi:hypothetical protein